MGTEQEGSMHNFMIGLYGGFEEEKYRRDFRKGFYGIEACLFEAEEEVEKLIREAKRNEFKIGIHFPIRSDETRLRDALFLAQDERVRQDAYDYIQQQLDIIGNMDPDYVLFHYPKPVLLDVRVNWDKWRFAAREEYAFESEYDYSELVVKSEQLFAWLHNKANEYSFTPVLEFDALNRYVYEEDFLESLLCRYPNIKLCLDTGRLFMQEKIDPSFDARAVLNRYAKYAKLVHLWNVQFTDSFAFSRYPALPHCRPEDGWAPIEDYLNLITAHNPDITIMFEHRSDWITEEELQTCYQWIDQIVNKKSPLPAGEH
jgi:sugar phosphate isomerase/epimerase